MPTSVVTLSQIQETASKIRHVLENGYNPAEFETDAPLHSNRGNKLKRKAEAYREGHLGGQRPFKKVCYTQIGDMYDSKLSI